MVPQSIVDGLRTLYCWREGELAAANLNNTNLNPRPDVRPWASSGAESAYRDFSRGIEERIDREPGLDHFVGRSAEKAVRLATVRAGAGGSTMFKRTSGPLRSLRPTFTLIYHGPRRAWDFLVG